MHTKMVGEKSDKYRPCWRFLTEGKLEEFVVGNSRRYLRLKQLVETNQKSNIKLLRELFAPEGDETTPVFQKNESSRQVWIALTFLSRLSHHDRIVDMEQSQELFLIDDVLNLQSS